MDCDTETILAETSDDIGRGHAEFLIGQIEACLERTKLSYNDLSRIAVTIGPGSFTGVRVGMAAASGFSIGLDIPVVGVSTLDAAQKYAQELGCDDPIAVLLDAKRDQAFGKLPDQAPQAYSYDDLVDRLHNFEGAICGSGAKEFLSRTEKEYPVVHEESASVIASVARLALKHPISKVSPEPLYLRSADAKRQTGFALPRVRA